MAASNYGNLAIYASQENLLYWVEEINYSVKAKLAILSKGKNNVLSRTI